MVLPILFYAFAALCLGTCIFVIAKRWKEIRLLDPSSIKEEKERLQRHEMIERRFERVSSEALMPLRRVGRALGRSAKTAYRSTYQRLHQLEQLYKKATRPIAAMTGLSNRDRIKTLINEARSLGRDLKWAEAERRLLDVLAVDPKHAEAYKLLGQLYLKQKLYPQAKETFEFLLKMKKADDATYAALSEIAEAEGNVVLAESMLQKAVDASPRQAYRHAEQAQFYLERGNAAKAWPAAKRASELEPGSAKYLEISLEAAILHGDLKEAKRRLDKLRLLSDDHVKYQSWKEKVSALEG